jgi:hypothetical protein
MQIGRWALASAEAEVQLGAVHSAVENVDEQPEELVEEAGDTAWTLARFHDRFGNHWVSGRVVISAEALEFRPRDQVNAVPLALRVGQVTAIESVSTLFNKAMRVQLATGEVLTFRCRNAAELVEGLQSAAGAARSAAA